MDILWFLQVRLKFIRQLHATASLPYVERKRLIENGEAPYMPPCTGDDEPPFLEEWIEADDSLHVLGYSCLSMLATALNLYFKAWERQSGYSQDSCSKKVFKDNGWLSGYQYQIASRLGIDFADAPVKLELLEEIILARNRVQHPDSISQTRPTFSASDLEKIRHPYFLDEREKNLFSQGEFIVPIGLLKPSIHASPENVYAAIDAVSRYAKWLEDKIITCLYPE
jgi:hypothetical protein